MISITMQQHSTTTLKLDTNKKHPNKTSMQVCST